MFFNLSEVSDNVETILWQAMQAHMLLTRIGEHFASSKQEEIAKLFYKKDKTMKKRSQLVRNTVLTQEIIRADAAQSILRNTGSERI